MSEHDERRRASENQSDHDGPGFNPTVSEVDEAALLAPNAPSEDNFSITGTRFDVTRYLTMLRGRGGSSPYLEVKWRLVWLRTEQPGASVETELVRLGDGFALFKAVVTLPGGAVGTGHGSETAGDFGDWLEKAETKAIGRALSTLGYGTQFSDEFLTPEGRDAEYPPVAAQPQRQAPAQPPRPAQAPPQRPAQRPPQRPAAQAARPAQAPPQDDGWVPPFEDEPPARPQRQAPATTAGQRRAEQADDKPQRKATERQVKFIGAVAREAGLDEQELATWMQELYNVDRAEDLSTRDASNFIEALQRRRNEVA